MKYDCLIFFCLKIVSNVIIYIIDFLFRSINTANMDSNSMNQNDQFLAMQQRLLELDTQVSGPPWHTHLYSTKSSFGSPMKSSQFPWLWTLCSSSEHKLNPLFFNLILPIIFAGSHLFKICRIRWIKSSCWSWHD